MQNAKAAEEIRHDANESEKFIKPRMGSFEHDLVGPFSRRGRSGLSWRGDGGWRRRRLLHASGLTAEVPLHNRENRFAAFLDCQKYQQKDALIARRAGLETAALARVHYI